MQYKYIAIEGNIGSGKTTLATMLSADFNVRLMLEEFAENPFLPKFYEAPDRHAFPLELFLWQSGIINLETCRNRICSSLRLYQIIFL
jgi:deoxyadenosine/deoxycytidine kinase